MMPDKAGRSHVWLLLPYLFIAASQPLFAPIESLGNAVGQEQITTVVEGIALKEIGLSPKQKLDTEKSSKRLVQIGFNKDLWRVKRERIGFRGFSKSSRAAWRERTALPCPHPAAWEGFLQLHFWKIFPPRAHLE